MMVKFLLPQTDLDAQRMMVQFKNDGMAPLSTDRMHLGFVRRVGEENGKILIVADVTEPDLVAWIKDNASEGGPIEIVPENGTDRALRGCA